MKKSATFQHDSIKGFKFGSDPFRMPKLFSHIYFVDGLLIDTGHRNMQKEIVQTIRPLSVEQIFLTHHHEDHTGNLQAFQDHFQCPSYASVLCVELMKKPPPISFAQRITWGNRPANFNIQVQERQITTTNYKFDLIPIPGHAIDMFALHEAQQGWLFSADLWVYDYIRYFMRAESMAQQIDSIKRVLELDFEVLLCSHNPQFKNGKQRLRNKLQFLETFYGSVAKLYHEGNSIPTIFKAMKLKRTWQIRLLSGGELSTRNMITSVIRDEQIRQKVV